MRALLLGVVLVGCGPSFPARWGETCELGGETCPAGWVCFVSNPLCGDDSCGRCEMPCEVGCPDGWRCDPGAGYCRIACGAGFDECPGGTVCERGTGCGPL